MIKSIYPKIYYNNLHISNKHADWKLKTKPIYNVETMPYWDINRSKLKQDLYTENCKISERNEMKSMECLWVERVSLQFKRSPSNL